MTKAQATDRQMLYRRTRIKICGITSEHLAVAAVEAGADAIGIVFVPTSPRYVLPGPAQRIARVLPPLISSIGVFSNPSDPDLQNWRGQWVQLHGQEAEPQLARIGQNRRIIKGFKFDPVQIRRWEMFPHVSSLLIDGSTGGNGLAFDYQQLAEMMPSINTPVILAGGLNPKNVGQAIKIVRPFGVDVSSGVESSRGVKEPSLIREFCQAVREADAAIMSRKAKV
ncbi:MAG: phosphoribosylanthranilate isomerase [Phycisphaerales bacterium]|nr:phosphoribosylanthranilate isomerase [Phycisphaerales bacterium]MCI0630188.1 phosphoribosylanthranilate isomerase [Phycisphaerales bacterium]MCI0677214.1 phosphoribosylanthranilate isomerase [Phycisphaerales bacterium]